jgi:DNA-binding GntR family transcriptional regulator
LTVSYRLSTDSFSVFLPLHRKVLDAILAHDAPGAREAMARLLSDTRDFLETRLSRPRARNRPRSGRARGAGARASA